MLRRSVPTTSQSIRTSNLEPISKSPEQNRDSSKLHEVQEVGRIEFPASEQMTLPLQPGKEAFHQLSPLLAAKLSFVLRFSFLPTSAVWRDRLDTFRLQTGVQRIAVTTLAAN
jgi:hypothetical protein